MNEANQQMSISMPLSKGEGSFNFADVLHYNAYCARRHEIMVIQVALKDTFEDTQA